MVSILSLTVPIYLVIVVGYAAVRRGMFSRDQMRVLSQFVVNFALPSLMFLAIASRTVAEILNPTYLTAYAAGTLAAFGLGYGYARLRNARVEARAFDGLGSSASNSGYVGYPLALLALPSVAGLFPRAQHARREHPAAAAHPADRVVRAPRPTCPGPSRSARTCAASRATRC